MDSINHRANVLTPEESKILAAVADRIFPRTETPGAVEIGADVWIGGGAIILSGVTIGDRAIVGAGAIVTRDVAEDTTVVGNPARDVSRRT